MDVQELHVTQLAAEEERPQGLWADAPALASTTVAMENTSEYDLEVTLYGGTWTVLKKNGVTLGGVTSALLAGAAFRLLLHPGATWALTYSGAPTAVQWSYA